MIQKVVLHKGQHEVAPDATLEEGVDFMSEDELIRRRTFNRATEKVFRDWYTSCGSSFRKSEEWKRYNRELIKWEKQGKDHRVYKRMYFEDFLNRKDLFIQYQRDILAIFNFLYEEAISKSGKEE